MEIPLTQGKVAIIDPEDWTLVAPYRWYATRSTDGRRWYAVAVPLDGKRGVAMVKMHNLILGLKGVDHIDENGLNNQRRNLRPANHAENAQNTGPRGGSSRFKGVSWDKRRRKWAVCFRCHGQYHFVGYFADAEAAARAYDQAVAPLAGEFARLNFPKAA